MTGGPLYSSGSHNNHYMHRVFCFAEGRSFVNDKTHPALIRAVRGKIVE